MLFLYNILEGDSIKKIKFLNVGYDNFYQVYLIIYDSNNNIIFEGFTYNGEVNICISENNIYKIEAKFLNEQIIKYFYVDNKNIYIFRFASSIAVKYLTVTFLLTDYYYDNLKIKEGKLFLWQNK